MMKYVDCMVAAVPTGNKEAYLKHAKEAWLVFKDHGALEMVECWGDDVPDGEVTSFPMAVKCGEDETVVCSWITWASKEEHDVGWQKIVEDPRMNIENNPIPFDGKRMIFGAFQVILEV